MRRILQEAYYTFTPATKTIVVPRYVPRERLFLITNVTTNVIIYNFSDSTLGLTAYSYDPVANTTTLVVSYNTSSMSSGGVAHLLSILVDEVFEQFLPAEAYRDPVGKLRVSTPQSLIDTDFEYGLQPTKWETLMMLNNKPSFFTNTQVSITITNITAVNGSRTITVTTTTPPTAGTPVYIQDSTYFPANGNFLVETVSAGTSFTYTCRSPFTGTTGTIFNSALSQCFSGTFYSGSSIAVSAVTSSGTAVTVTTTNPHGLTVGNPIYAVNFGGTTPPNGSWIVATVTSPTVFVFYCASAPSGVTAGTIYYRPEATYIHRAFDGGVQFSPNNTSHGNQILRQSRRYFRYQSGKGIQMSTNVIFQPQFNIDSMTSSGTTVTVVTKLQHNLNPSVNVVITGANETAYNGTFLVSRIISDNIFQYTANTTPSQTTASGLVQGGVAGWYGAVERAGMFDSQNGFFFEYDGQTQWAVRRHSTFQISGFINATNGSCTVTGATINGVSTLFSKQLIPGDWIVIRGMSYRVLAIASDTSMTIFPEYRGTTLSGNNVAIISKTIEIRTAQSAWNIDRADGTGPTGYKVDWSKAQMLYMDYSWYGAGYIRFGLKDNFGDINYFHKYVNNNVNTEAFMRSGNLPARYETNTFCYYTPLTVTCGSTDTTMTVSDTSRFPSSGTLLLENEYINYTGKTSTTFTGLTRGQGGVASLAGVTTTLNSPILTTTTSLTGIQIGQYIFGTGIAQGAYVVSFTTGATNTIVMNYSSTIAGTATLILAAMGSGAVAHTVTATAPLSVQLHAPFFAPTISHWGTSIIMDGRFDDDKSYLFTNGMTSALAVASGVSNALMGIRLGPSVDSGVTGLLGAKEIINRMQLTLRNMSTLSNGQFLISFVLNPAYISGTTPSWSNLGGSSLVQYINFTAATTIVGGEVVYAFYTDNAGGTNFSKTDADLGLVRDLGNSIIGGGTDNLLNSSSATPYKNIYPDGPDVIIIIARNIDSASKNIQARISWSEAQA